VNPSVIEKVPGVVLEVTVSFLSVTLPVVESRWFWKVKAFESNPEVEIPRVAALAVLVAVTPAVHAA
jgi:hypothetical protein